MSVVDRALEMKRILVTGATGFIGGRLAERLALEEAAVVTGTGRNLAAVPFLQETAVDLRQVDLLDTEAMRQVVAGQEVVFHVAAWLARRGDARDRAYAVNVSGTETLVRLAAEAGVRRLVLVSSVTAYGVPQRAVVDEEYPLAVDQPDLYGRTKALGEQNGCRLGQSLGLDIVIVRPAMVYGPRSQSYTVQMLRLVKSGTPVLFGGGTGHAYPVYVDNLIDGMLLAAVRPGAAGEAFNLCDEAVDWRTWFGYFGRMAGREPRGMPLWGASLIAWANEQLRLGLPLNRQRVDYLMKQASFPIGKAERLLGYQPRVSLDEGMRRSEAWLRQSGYLKDSPL